ncbi:hypothetical protein P692DRAFT_20827222 [Suillus brevipes Sb2]|nr:hypothetical protein P692DRAFT_20827222 [Suillus brevipes Sb2]
MTRSILTISHVSCSLRSAAPVHTAVRLSEEAIGSSFVFGHTYPSASACASLLNLSLIELKYFLDVHQSIA